jgi:adenylate cyclase
VADDERAAARIARATRAVRETNRRPELVRALRAAREVLPGDENFGDRLSAADGRPSAVIARFLAERPGLRAASEGDGGGEALASASREAALAGLQLWQVLSQRVGRGAGTVEATVLFTDLSGFSTWVLEAGDERALELLRAVASVVEPAITARRGRVVKRLGDGHMAVFSRASCGVEAALEMQEGLSALDVGGYRPRLRVGLHTGQPRQLGGDYLGTDVNIAARVSEAAGPGEVLVSGPLLAALEEGDRDQFEVKRRRGFRAKGAPPGLEVFVVSRRAAAR